MASIRTTSADGRAAPTTSYATTENATVTANVIEDQVHITEDLREEYLYDHGGDSSGMTYVCFASLS